MIYSSPSKATFVIDISDARTSERFGVSIAVFNYFKRHHRKFIEINTENLPLYTPDDKKEIIFDGPLAEIAKVASKVKKLFYSSCVLREKLLTGFATDIFATYHLRRLEREWGVSMWITQTGDTHAIGADRTYDIIIVGARNEPGVW